MKKDCEARLRDLVPADETVVAVGTAEELRSLGSDIGSGGGWTFIVVTPERVLFARWDSPEKPHEDIRLDEVIHWAHGRQYNCHALVLTHPPMTRRQRGPARRILWFKWGEAEADIVRTQTVFRFSRPDTEVAKTIRAALEARNVPRSCCGLRRSREKRARGAATPADRKQADPIGPIILDNGERMFV